MLKGVTKERLLSVLRETEWHQPIHNGNPRCPYCDGMQPSTYRVGTPTNEPKYVTEGGHAAGCRLQALIEAVERSEEGETVPNTPPNPKHKYLKAVVKVALVVDVEDIDMPSILDKYREDGAAKLVSAEIIEIEDDKIDGELHRALTEA